MHFHVLDTIYTNPVRLGLALMPLLDDEERHTADHVLYLVQRQGKHDLVRIEELTANIRDLRWLKNQLIISLADATTTLNAARLTNRCAKICDLFDDKLAKLCECDVISNSIVDELARYGKA